MPLHRFLELIPSCFPFSSSLPLFAPALRRRFLELRAKRVPGPATQTTQHHTLRNSLGPDRKPPDKHITGRSAIGDRYPSIPSNPIIPHVGNLRGDCSLLTLTFVFHPLTAIQSHLSVALPGPVLASTRLQQPTSSCSSIEYFQSLQRRRPILTHTTITTSVAPTTAACTLCY